MVAVAHVQVGLAEVEAGAQLAELVLDGADEERVARVIVIELHRFEGAGARRSDEGGELEQLPAVAEHAVDAVAGVAAARAEALAAPREAVPAAERADEVRRQPLESLPRQHAPLEIAVDLSELRHRRLLVEPRQRVAVEQHQLVDGGGHSLAPVSLTSGAP